MASTNITELKKAAKLPAKKAGGSTVSDFFQANRAAIAAVLPRHVSPDRMLRIALGALRQTPQLMECTTESLFGAVVQCAQLGLEPNGALGHVYLIPFRDGRKGTTEVQVIPGYRGLIDLARRSGQIVSIAAHVVHEHDDFDYRYGLDERLDHRPADGERGDITHVYAVAKLRDGGHQFEVMPIAEVRKLAKSSGPWRDHFAEMARKTAIRRLFKYLPVSIEMARAAELHAQVEDDEPQRLGGLIIEGAAETEQVAPRDPTDPEAVKQIMRERIDAASSAEEIAALADEVHACGDRDISAYYADVSAQWKEQTQ